MPFFSVVIPVYNKANFVAKTLQSVLKQSFSDFEVIIVNDGSTDQSLEIIKQNIDQRCSVFNQDNQGASAARNYGVSQAQSEWIAFLDADDFWYSNHLEELHKTIEVFTIADVVSNAYEIELSKNYIKTPSYSKSFSAESFIVEDYFQYSFIDPLFWTSSLALKAKVFQNIGGFDTEIKTGQDLDLVIRLALNFTLAYNNIVTLKYKRYTENNLSLYTNLREKKTYIDKNKVHEDQNKSLKKYLDINRFSLALQAKVAKDKSLLRECLADLDFDNLSAKQRKLLKLPGFALMALKKMQSFLIRIGVYKSAF